ncbi:MAG TPA: tetratricopeptide repeat protein [Desulfobacterales bacterium]|nr:tetratricopeptide repeat protein [Desulfobacterales bacterium]
MLKPLKFISSILFSILILIFFLIFSYQLSLRLFSQILYQKGINHNQDQKYDLAVAVLKKAVSYQRNDPEIWKALGRAYHFQGVTKPFSEAFDVFNKASKAFLKATNLNLLDSEAFFGLAVETTRLEQLYPYVFHKKGQNPHNSLPYFQKAIRLRPNSIYYHYPLARYLNEQNNKDLLMQTIRNMARIYPQTYYKIEKEPFWSSEASKAFKSGLKQAIDEKISLRSAHMVMSILLSKENDWSTAINHYKTALTHQADENNSGNYLYLGRLYLENGQLKDAEEIFLKALTRSREKEKHLKHLYWVYKKMGHLKDIDPLFQRIKNRLGTSQPIDIMTAQAFIELKNYRQAEDLLTTINKKKPSAESYSLLARIAESEKNWDKMELTIQKASVLEPRNWWYHYKFSEVSKRLKKLDKAEKEAGLAIQYNQKPSAWMFNHRGWIRWDKKDYPGAVKDWEQAIILKPQKAYLYAQAARGYHKMGQWERTVEYYQKAMNLDPKNKKYQKKYNFFKEKVSSTQSN